MRHAIGIDLGGTAIKYAIVEEGNGIVFNGKLPSNAQVGAHAIMDALICSIEICKRQAAESGFELCGVGICTPGIVDQGKRIVIGGAENLKGWSNISLANEIEASTGLATMVDNDANLMGLGETAFGAAKGCQDVVFITVGTGIGGAVVIAGKLFGGYRNRGTELGHIVLFADGEKCACGSIGCLERYCSTTSLLRRHAERVAKAGGTLDKDFDGEKLVALFQAGDPLSVESFNEHCRFLGQGLASFVNIFAPQKIVIGGGISEAGSFYIDMISENVHKFALKESAENTQVVAAALGNMAGCMGAAEMIFN